MVGVVLETLSTKKLVILGVVLILLQITCFLLGGLISPSPYSYEDMLANQCVDWDNKPDAWFFTRGSKNCTPLSDHTNYEDFVKALHDRAKQLRKSIPNASQIVFNIQFPLPRDNTEFKMSPLFQEMVGVIKFEIEYLKGKAELAPDASIELHMRLGYREEHDEPGVWHELVSSQETRPLVCELKQYAGDTATGEYECQVQPLFSLGSVSHDHYLLNIRVPVISGKVNHNIGLLRHIWVVEFHQSGGFTYVWLGMKSVLFPFICGLLVWFYKRVADQLRPATLLEKSIGTLGVILSILNCPIEWLSLTVLKAPVWILVSDFRFGMFYTVLLAFWIIFTGEHMMDSGPKNRLLIYWKYLLTLLVGGSCLLIFDLSERGVQIYNPFYSVWSNYSAAKFALANMILAGICVCCYVIFLIVMIVRAVKGILSKRRHLPTLPAARRLFYTGAIYRFCMLLVYTAVCAMLTVAFYIVMELDESHWKWAEEGRAIEYSSAFITGVYGMWNIYVLAIVILYAPSTKRMQQSEGGDLFTTESDAVYTQVGESTQMHELYPSGRAGPSEGMAFIQKAAED